MRSAEMRFVEPTVDGPPAPARRPTLALVVASASSLTPLEELAVRIGAADPRSSQFEPGLVRRWSKALFGFRPPTRLADPHLEALRALAAGLGTASGRRAAAAIGRARASGLSDPHIRLATLLVQDSHTNV